MKRYVLILTALLLAGPAHAEEPRQGWNGLDRAALSTVFVLDDGGVETRGQLIRLDRDAVVVLVNGSERHFETARVARVSRRGDSLKNGALIGLAVGLAQALFVTATQECRDSCDRGLRATMLATNTAVSAAIGTALDATISGRTVLYQAPASRQTIGSPRGASISMRVSW
jgi:hypothetical protein